MLNLLTKLENEGKKETALQGNSHDVLAIFKYFSKKFFLIRRKRQKRKMTVHFEKLRILKSFEAYNNALSSSEHINIIASLKNDHENKKAILLTKLEYYRSLENRLLAKSKEKIQIESIQKEILK